MKSDTAHNPKLKTMLETISLSSDPGSRRIRACLAYMAIKDGYDDKQCVAMGVAQSTRSVKVLWREALALYHNDPTFRALLVKLCKGICPPPSPPQRRCFHAYRCRMANLSFTAKEEAAAYRVYEEMERKFNNEKDRIVNPKYYRYV